MEMIMGLTVSKLCYYGETSLASFEILGIEQEDSTTYKGGSTERCLGSFVSPDQSG